MHSASLALVPCAALIIAVAALEDPPSGPRASDVQPHSPQSQGSVPRSSEPPQWRDFEEMNRFYVDAFVAGRNFGLTRLMDPDFPQFKRLEVSGQRYTTDEVQLVGLLEQPEPRVYELFGNPTKRELLHALARPLEAFERSALEALQGGAEMVVEPAANAARALGAIRARQQCLRCHAVAPGELLGAFSYRLVLDVTDTPDAPDAPFGMISLNAAN